jgi:hypothetical protein
LRLRTRCRGAERVELPSAVDALVVEERDVLTLKGATGTLLSNIFAGEPAEVSHPRYLEKYLNTGTYTGSGTEYADYHRGMLEFCSKRAAGGAVVLTAF